MPRRSASRFGRRFLAVWTICVLGSLAAVGVVNAVVDPLGRLGHNRLGIYHSAEFEFKVARISVGDFDGIMMGSSKTANLDPALFPQTRIFNAAFGGALPEEMYLLLQANARHLRGKYVILCMDFFMFSERSQSIRGATLVAPDAEAILKYVLSLRTLYFSAQTVYLHGRGVPSQLLGNGARRIDDMLLENAQMSTVNYGDKVQGLVTALYEHYVFSERRIKILRQIRTLLEANGIRYQVVINPDNRQAIAALRAAGLGSDFERYHREIRGVFPDVLDYSEGRYSGEDSFFRASPFYFTIEVGRTMIDEALAAVGVRK